MKPIKNIIPNLKHYFILNLFASFILSTYLIFSQSIELGLRPYIVDISESIRNLEQLIIYVAKIIVIIFLFEIISKKYIQEYTSKNSLLRIKILSFVIISLIWSSIQFKFGYNIMLYSFFIGLLGCIYYHYTNNLKTLIAWHIQWAILTMALIFTITIFFEGEVRDRYMFSYKKHSIDSGRIYYRNNWGWVDKSHYEDSVYLKALKDLRNGKDNIIFKTGYLGIFGNIHYVEAKYKILQTNNLTKEEIWASLSGMYLDFSRLTEYNQEIMPIYHGSHLSAWQFDDLPSNLLMCLDQFPGKKVKIDEIFNVEKLHLKWLDEGLKLVSLKSYGKKVPISANLEYKYRFEMINKMNHTWKRISHNKKS